MEGAQPEPAVAARCLSCNAALVDETPRCGSCGFTLQGVSLYRPKYFILLAFLLSGMVPLYLSASNWGRIGQTRKKWKYLGLGGLLFVMFFTAFILLGEIGHSALKFLGYLINLPVGYALKEMQEPLYSAGRRLGATRASTIKGSIIGVGLTACAIAIPALAFTVGVEIQFAHGAVLLEQGRHEEAAIVFERVLRWNREDENARINLALCRGGSAWEAQEYDEALEYFRQAAAMDPENAYVHYSIAWCHLMNDDFTEAEGTFARAVKLDPGNTYLMVDHARALTALERSDEAIETLRQALDLGHSETDTPLMLLGMIGDAHVELAEEGASVDHIGGVVIYRGTDPETEQNFRRQQLELAAKAFETAMEFDDLDPEVLARLAEVYEKLDRTDDACAVWEQLVGAFPEDAEGRFGLGRCLEASGNDQGALRSYALGLATSPWAVEAHEHVAKLREKRGERAQALASQRRAEFYRFIPPFLQAEFDDKGYEIVSVLRLRFDESNPEVHLARIQTLLEDLIEDGSLPSLTFLAAFCWHHSHDQLEDLAFRGLEQNSEAAATLLRSLLRHGDAQCTKRGAGMALARMKDPEAYELLIDELHTDRNVMFPIAVARALEELGDPRAVPQLIGVLEAERTTSSSEGEEDGMNRFAQSMADRGWQEARRRAALALGSFDFPRSIAALQSGLEDPSVAAYCAVALYRLTEDEPYLDVIDPELHPDAFNAAALSTYLEDNCDTEKARALARRLREMSI